jgi:hypothetical protein
VVIICLCFLEILGAVLFFMHTLPPGDRLYDILSINDISHIFYG